MSAARGVSRVTADRGAVTVARGWLVPGRERAVRAPEVAEVTTRRPRSPTR